MDTENIVEDLVDRMNQTKLSDPLPDMIVARISFFPELILDLLPYYMTTTEHSQDEASSLKLIHKCLEKLSSDLNQEGNQSAELFENTQDAISACYDKPAGHKPSKLSEIIYRTGLQFEINFGQDFVDQKQKIDIMPTIPRLIEGMKQSSPNDSIFDLYDALMSQIHLFPDFVLIRFAAELAYSTKPLAHEIAMLFLLHPRKIIREACANIFFFSDHTEIFTSVDLRRLIVLRNWILEKERSLIDKLIRKLRSQRLSPAPYPVSHINKLMATTFDNSGTQVILFEVKEDQELILGGFTVKIGFGIRHYWTKIKRDEKEFEKITKMLSEEVKPINLSYLRKTIKHFIAETHAYGKMPPHRLLEIAEKLGARSWEAGSLSIQTELNQLKETVDYDPNDEEIISESFKRQIKSIKEDGFFSQFFEYDDSAQEKLHELFKTNKDLSDMDSLTLTNKVDQLVVEHIIKPKLNKWKTLILFTCLWARSEVVKNPLSDDLLILLSVLEENKKPLIEIPFIKKIVVKSVIMLMNKKLAELFIDNF